MTGLRIMAEEEPITISFDAIAAYHGQAALAMLAIIFQGLRLTVPLLSTDVPVSRSALHVVSGHPGPGVRDAFEFVTRAVTRDAYVVDRGLPDSRFNPHAPMSYSFRIGRDGQSVTAALQPGVLPDRFFALLRPPSGERTAKEADEFSRLKRSIATSVLGQEPEALFRIS